MCAGFGTRDGCLGWSCSRELQGEDNSSSQLCTANTPSLLLPPGCFSALDPLLSVTLAGKVYSAFLSGSLKVASHCNSLAFFFFLIYFYLMFIGTLSA